MSKKSIAYLIGFLILIVSYIFHYSGFYNYDYEINDAYNIMSSDSDRIYGFNFPKYKEYSYIENFDWYNLTTLKVYFIYDPAASLVNPSLMVYHFDEIDLTRNFFGKWKIQEVKSRSVIGLSIEEVKKDIKNIGFDNLSTEKREKYTNIKTYNRDNLLQYKYDAQNPPQIDYNDPKIQQKIKAGQDNSPDPTQEELDRINKDINGR